MLLHHAPQVNNLPPGAEDLIMVQFLGADLRAAFFETSLAMGPTTGFTRVEWAKKDELFSPPDSRHSELFEVWKVDVGLVRDVADWGGVTMSVGGTAGLHILPDALSDAYGDSPNSLMIFTRIGL